MKLHSLDIAIIGVYFVTTILIGLWVSRRGAKDLDSYFLGGKSLPWYLLGISDASGMFDISGTMLMVYWLLGLRAQEHLAAVPVAGVQPDLPDDVPERLAAALERAHRRGVDPDPVRARHRGEPGPPERGVLRARQVIGMLAYAFKGIGKFAVVMLALALYRRHRRACSPTRTSTRSSSSC